MDYSHNIIPTAGRSRKKPVTKPRYFKSDAVIELERLVNTEARAKYPYHTDATFAPRKYKDDTANSLTKCITSYLKLKGAFVSRLNNTGVYDTRLKRYRPGTNRRGLPDIVCTCRGRSLFIEVKSGRDRMSEDQERVRDEQISSGGFYFIARNFADFKVWFDAL